MTQCTIYVGDLNDPRFSWNDGDWNGNTPRALTTAFPPRRRSYGFADYFEWLKGRGIAHQQTDWGAFVAKVTRADIVAFIAFCYDSDTSYNDPAQMLRWKGKAYLVAKLKRLKKEVRALKDDCVYGLVAMEE